MPRSTAVSAAAIAGAPCAVADPGVSVTRRVRPASSTRRGIARPWDGLKRNDRRKRVPRATLLCLGVNAQHENLVGQGPGERLGIARGVPDALRQLDEAHPGLPPRDETGAGTQPADGALGRSAFD